MAGRPLAARAGRRLRRTLAPLGARIAGTRLGDGAYDLWHWLARSGGGPNAHYDRLTVEVIDAVLGPDDAAIDVGAHRGTVLRHIVRAAPRGDHLAVEPLPAFARALRHRFPGVDVRQVALGERPGRAVFQHVVTNPSYSGLARRSYPADEVVETLDVEVETLDRLVASDRPVRFVKIDVEGGELAVVRGATGLLARCRPVVVFEHGWPDGHAPRDQPTAQLLDVFTGAGLSVWRLDGWLAGGPPLDRLDLEAALAGGEYYFLAAAARR